MLGLRDAVATTRKKSGNEWEEVREVPKFIASVGKAGRWGPAAGTFPRNLISPLSSSRLGQTKGQFQDRMRHLSC